MVEYIFFELSVVIGIAALVSFIMKLVKQPLVIGYILTGIVVGPAFLDVVQTSDALVAFSQIGIVFLLFIVGLNLNFSTLKESGVVALVTGVGQVIFTFLIGFLISTFFGFGVLPSLYISIALTFSSTIIIVKLLSDKQDMDSLYGKISIGFLLVQDFIAMFILMILSSTLSTSAELPLSEVLFFTGIKIFSIAFLLLAFTVHVLPKLTQYVAKSQELLFLFGISWVLILSVVIGSLGFSVEIGALLAGICLASSPFHFEIGNKLKSLRDFFIILFFVYLGTQMVFTSASSNIVSKIIFYSLFILIGNPLIVMTIMGMMGYRKRVSFMAGLTVAQISEFSLILVTLGYSLGHLSQEIVSMVTAIGLITIAGSTYMIMYSHKLYSLLSKYLSVFEKKELQPVKMPHNHKYKIILFGYNRIGYNLLHSFKKLNKKFLVIDYNPEVISVLEKEKVPYKYGDVSDSELLDELDFHKVEMVISTVPQLDTNLILLEKVRSFNKKAIVIITSLHIDESLLLYEKGADYVIMPHFLGGKHASSLIESFGTNVNKFLNEKVKHLAELTQRRNMGHEHPDHHKM
jgi:Kef-type K+ transport system membrane component KefB/Trk K+ transport system NAD-binding subunit